MYTTITNQHKDFFNLNIIEDNIKFIYAFKNYGDIIIVVSDWKFKYEKFKDYYIKYYYRYNKLYKIEYLNYSGKLHRKNGPAYIKYYDNGNIQYKLYYLNGNRHREEGPAWIEYYDNGKIKYKQFYLNGIKYSYKDYLDKLNII